jgi:endonuclease/exonuclease/phosphatase family metal-dependent hydrolase
MAPRLFRTLIIVVALAIILICAAYEVGPERWWPLAFLQYVPYYIFLVPALFAFAISFKLSIRWRLVAGSALVLVLTILMDLAIGIGDKGTESIRIMTYNVKDYIALGKADGLSGITDEVAKHDPDILVLQDAENLNSAWQTEPSQLLPLYGNRHVYTYGQFAVASRYPLRECEPGKISFRRHRRTYIHCIVDTGFTQIDLYTVHFLTPRYGLNAVRNERISGIDDWEQNVEDRIAQSGALAQDLRNRIRPIILAGDFNAPNSSLVIRNLLSTGMRDAFSIAGIGYGYTYGHSLRPGISFLRIDHIFVDSSIGVANCFVGDKLVSPHRAVIADLLLNRQSK